jgi:hypothetical protein
MRRSVSVTLRPECFDPANSHNKAMSAIAALTARRREAAASATSAQQSSEPDEKPPTSNVNYFSPLQKGTSQVRTSSTPKKSTVKTPRSQRGTESPAAHPKSDELARYITQHH